jgi:lycopene beta-cyclase
VTEEHHDVVDCDVVVVGDGPAGSALAKACGTLGLDVLLVGDDAEWGATYGTWHDELLRTTLLTGHDVSAGELIEVGVWGDQHHALGRSYTLLDNDALRLVLRDEVPTLTDRVDRIDSRADRHVIHLASGGQLKARLVIDAAGWPSVFARRTHRDQAPFWQTAFGVVLPEPPDGDLGQPTLMDYREPPRVPSAPRRAHAETTFAYSLPVADGWLVEETVLAARPAIEPVALVPRLAARLGVDPDAMLDGAVRTEYVRIPMGGARPRRDQPVVAFGAAAGYVNPTSGYSVVHSMQMATPVAAAIEAALVARPSTHVGDSLAVWNAVWPVAHRRTRVLHDYGLDMLSRLDGAAVREFFDAFFELPLDTWSAYMRADTSPTELSGVMITLFRAAPWSIRRRLVRGNPAAFARIIRPD